MRSFVIAISIAVIGLVLPAFAQTALQTQATDHGTYCDNVGSDVNDIRLCGVDAQFARNYLSAKKAWARAAADGDEVAAESIGQMYENGDGGPIDYALAYKWYDIAAAIDARRISRLPPAAGPGAEQSNQDEIDERNAVGRKLNSAQIAEALASSRKWQAIYLH